MLAVDFEWELQVPFTADSLLADFEVEVCLQTNSAVVVPPAANLLLGLLLMVRADFLPLVLLVVACWVLSSVYSLVSYFCCCVWRFFFYRLEICF